VRSICEAWERGDYSSADWAHAEIEYVFADGPSPGTWTGMRGLAEGFRDFFGAWEDFRTEGEDYRELDDQRVLVFLRFAGRGKRSGLELARIQTLGAAVFRVRGGKVTRAEFYFDREHVLDLGLDPPMGE
jgi:ketosteroid isomerase-like protein